MFLSLPASSERARMYWSIALAVVHQMLESIVWFMIVQLTNDRLNIFLRAWCAAVRLERVSSTERKGQGLIVLLQVIVDLARKKCSR